MKIALHEKMLLHLNSLHTTRDHDASDVDELKLREKERKSFLIFFMRNVLFTEHKKAFY